MTSGRASPAEPERRVLQLVYEAPPECPSRDEFAKEMSARLGYVPLDDTAERSASVRVRRDEQGTTVTYVVIEPREGGAPLVSKRSIVSQTSDCREAVRSAALALALYLDPVFATTAHVEPPHEDAAAPPPSEPAPQSPERRVHGYVDGVGGLFFGIGPSPSLDMRLGVGVERRPFSLGVEGRAAVSLDSRTLQDADVSVTVLGGNALGCGHIKAIIVCAEGGAGRYEARAEAPGVFRSAAGFLPYAALRFGGAFALGDHLRVMLLGNFGANLRILQLQNAGATQWETPPVYGGLSLGVRWLL